MKKITALGLVFTLIVSLLSPGLVFADSVPMFKTFDVIYQDTFGASIEGTQSNYNPDNQTLYVYAPQVTSGSLIIQGVNQDDSRSNVSVALSTSQYPQHTYDDSTHALNLGAVQGVDKDEVYGMIDNTYSVVLTVYSGSLPIVNPNGFVVTGNPAVNAAASTVSVSSTYATSTSSSLSVSLVISTDQSVLEAIRNKRVDLSTVSDLKYASMTVDSYNHQIYMSQPVTGLSPQTTYYFAIVNSVTISDSNPDIAGTYQFFGGDIRNFTTTQPPALPTCTFEVSAQAGAYFSRVNVKPTMSDYSIISFLGVESSTTQDFASVKDNKMPYYNTQENMPVTVEMVSDTVYYRPFIEIITGDRVYGDMGTLTRGTAPTSISMTAGPGIKSSVCDFTVEGLSWGGDGVFEVLSSTSPLFTSFEQHRLYFDDNGWTAYVVENLTPETTYYFKAVVRSAEMTGTTVLESAVVQMKTDADAAVALSDLGNNQPLFDFVVQSAYKTADTLMKSDLEKLLYLYAGSSNPLNTLEDFTGIEALSNLRDLHIDDASGLTSLNGLDKALMLKRLAIHNTKVSDLTPILSLTGLKSLEFVNANISDISGLSGLVNLQDLYISRCRLTSLPNLSALVNLKAPKLNAYSSSFNYALSFTENAIPASEFTADKLPPLYYNYPNWLSDQIQSQRESLDPVILVSPEYFGDSSGVPFFVELSNVNALGYKMDVTIGGTPMTDLSFESSSPYGGNDYYKAGIANALSYVTANTPVSVQITVKDDTGATIYNETKAVTFRTNLKIQREGSSEFIYLGAPSLYLNADVYVNTTSQSVKIIRVKDNSGKTVMASTSLGYNKVLSSSLYEDERYRGLFNHYTLPQTQGLSVYGELYRVADMPTGLYDMEIEMNDGVKISQFDALEVVDKPVVYEAFYKYDAPRPMENKDNLYITVAGIKLDPEQLRPYIKSANGEILAEISGWRWEYKGPNSDTISFELTKKPGVNWTLSNNYQLDPRIVIEAAPGYDLRVENEANFISYLKNGTIYYSVYNPVDKVIDIRTQGYADGSYTAELLYQGSSSDVISTAQVTLVNGLGAINFQKDGAPYPFEENSTIHYRLINGNQSSYKSFYCPVVEINMEPNGSYTTYFKEYVNSDETSKEVTVYFVDEVAATDIVTAVLKKEGSVLQSDIPVALSTGKVNDKDATIGLAEVALSTLQPGRYDIYFMKSGTTLKAHIQLSVLDATKFIPENIYIEKTSAETAEINVYAYGLPLDNDKFTVEIKDIFGAIVTNVQSTAAYDSENQRVTISLSGLPVDQGLLEAKIAYDGKIPYCEDNLNKPYYEDHRYAALIDGRNVPKKNYLRSENSYVIKGVGGEIAGFPVTLKVYNPYDTGLVKQMTVTAQRDFKASDLTGLVPGKMYVAVLFSADGTISYFQREAIFKGFDSGVTTKVDVTGISMNQTTLNLIAASTHQLMATVSPENATNKAVTWSTSDVAVATVSANGLVTAVGAGTAGITARTVEGDFAAVCQVTVTQPDIPVTGINVNMAEMNLSVGDIAYLKATVIPLNATLKTYTWSSDNPTVATVDAQGKVTALAVGTAKLTVTSTDRSYKKDVTITVNGNISGRLLKDGTPAAYAWVYLEKEGVAIYSGYADYKGDFIFKRVKPGTYTLKSNAFDNNYKQLTQTVQLADGSQTTLLGDLSFASIYAHDGVLTANLKNEAGTSPYTGEVYYYLNNYETGTYKSGQITPDSNGQIVISGLSYSDLGIKYDFSISNEAYWNYEQVTLKTSAHDVSVSFNIPVTYTVSGNLTSEGVAVPFESVVLKSSANWFWGYTDQNGNYVFRGVRPGAYTLGVDNSSKFIVKTPDEELALTVTDNNLTGKNLSVITGADLKGKVLLNGVTPAFKAYLNLLDENDQYVGYGTAGESGFMLQGAIKKAGTYKLQISGVMNEDWTYPMIQASTKTIVVTEDMLKTGRIEENISYSLISATSILSGDGNSVLADKTLVKKGDLINLTVKYKNNGTQTANASFTVTLPSGVTAVNSGDLSFTVSDLAAGSSGQKHIPVRIGTLTETYVGVNVKATVTGTSGQIDFGNVALEKVEVTINGPETAKVGKAFKVYGEATANTNIVIKNMSNGQILATTKPSGRWYSASVTLDTVGQYALMAQIASDEGNIKEVSTLLSVDASADPILIENVKSSSAGMAVLPVNKVIGVRAFTAWVDTHLNGRDINIGTKFDKTNITEVTYHFSGKDYTSTKDGEGYFTTNLTGWSGAGLKTITATVKTNDGRTLNFIIAEVTVLIDPSGYVVDKETGSRLSGATLICEVQDTNTGAWSTWNAELYGQVNPQVSDADGNYGWMVPEGTYRVRAIMNNYGPYLTTEDTEHPTNQVIVIPPVRTDVNIFLSPATWVTGISIDASESTVEAGKTLQLSATAAPNDAVNASYIKWRSSNTTVATVSESGVVSAMAEGIVTITAYFDAAAGEKTATKEITVTKSTQGGGDAPTDNPGDTPTDNGRDDKDSGSGSDGTSTPSTPTTGGTIVPNSGGVTVSPGGATAPEAVKGMEKAFNANGEITMKGADIKGLSMLTIKGAVNLAFNAKALEILGATESLSVKVTTIDPATLTEQAKIIIGNRPVFEFIVKDGDKMISSFGEGKVNIEIPYKLMGNEDPNNLVVYYIDGEGGLVPMACRYDNGMITFATSHFSKYAVGYNKVNFSDVSGWYADSVNYLSSKGIISGAGEGLFMPNKNITRAEVVQILSKLASADLTVYKSSSFTDVKASDWYMPAVEWAKAKGLASGTGEGTFNPDEPISRQDFAVMINNYLTKLEKTELEVVKKPSVFADQAVIAAYADASVEMMQTTGLISGKPGNLFDPTGKATRAEAAKILELLLKAMLQ